MNTNPVIRSGIVLSLLLTAASAAAQNVGPGAPSQTAPAPSLGPPILPINSASAVSSEAFGSILGVRELPDGRVLVNDGNRRRLLLMDSTLTTATVVLDSLTEVANAYGTRPGALIPFRGDSTLFVDPASYAVLVIDPQGKLARVGSVWRVEHISSYANPLGAAGWPGIDARGRIVYRIPAQPALPLVPPPPGVPYIPSQPDSAFIVAVDLSTRMVDTIASIRVPGSEVRVRQSADGSISANPVIHPLPTSDDWSVLADGRVAIVRGIDYRIEYLEPDGRWTSSAKLPFDWRRLTDEDKARMIDSVKTTVNRTQATSYVTSMIRWVNQYRQQYPADFAVPEGFTLPPGFAQEWRLPPGLEFPENYIYGCPAGVEPTVTSVTIAGPGGGGAEVVRGGLGGGQAQVFTGPGGADGPGPIIITRDATGLGGAAGPGPAGGPREAGAPGVVRGPGGAATSGPQGGAGSQVAGAPPEGRPSCIPQPVMMTGGVVPPPPAPREVHVVSASEIPDYRPPLPPGGGTRADADGNLWIRTVPMDPIPGGPVYDIVDPQGELVSRVQLPLGYAIVGFGPDRVVYLSTRDAAGLKLARVRLR